MEGEDLTKEELDRLSEESFNELMQEDMVEDLFTEILENEEDLEEELEFLVEEGEEDLEDLSDFIDETSLGPIFNYEKFEEEVETLLTEAEEEDFEELTEEEYEQLLSMILGTSERLDTYFKRFEDE